MVIQSCYEEHEVPQHHQHRHQAEQEPHHRRVLWVFCPHSEELFVLQLGQRGVRPAGVVRHSLVLLSPDVVLDPLPPQVGLPLLVHHQVAEDEEEAVAG